MDSQEEFPDEEFSDASASREKLEATRIPSGQHPVVISKIDRDAVHVLKKLSAAGFDAYLVGGGVRDIYLNKAPKDFDISTSARPGQIRKLFPNSTTIGRRFRLVQIFFANHKIIEVSTLRSLSEHDLEDPDSVLAPNNSFGTLEEDAQRRDITINSLFFDISNQSVIDYVGGVDDLQRSTIRLIGLPAKRVHTDPVRMMRVIRHSARSGFVIEPQTWQAVLQNCQKLTLCPPSRIRDELFKDLGGGAAAPWFDLAVDSGIFSHILPLYKKILGTKNARAKACRQQIQALLTIADTINRQESIKNSRTLPEHFMLTGLLIPYVELTYRMFSEKRKGSALFQLSKRLRTVLDSGIGVSLNLRRSLRQDITSLLANLSLLIQHKENDTWPKWLRQKKYFAEAHFMYTWYMAATDAAHEKPVAAALPELSSDIPREEAETDGGKEKRRQIKPALVSVKKGGIFGLKK